MYELKTEYGIELVELEIHRYHYGNNIALQLVGAYDREPYCMLTVNLEDSENDLADDEFYVDTNNCWFAPEFLMSNNIASPTGRVGHSGYCEYPIYKLLLK